MCCFWKCSNLLDTENLLFFYSNTYKCISARLNTTTQSRFLFNALRFLQNECFSSILHICFGSKFYHLIRAFFSHIVFCKYEFFREQGLEIKRFELHRSATENKSNIAWKCHWTNLQTLRILNTYCRYFKEMDITLPGVYLEREKEKGHHL